MKSILFIAFLTATNIFCQTNINVIGKWQCCDSLVTSGYLYTLEFKNDSSFIYKNSEYNDDNTLQSISGKYKVNLDTLIFIVKEKLYFNEELKIGDRINEDASLWVLKKDKARKVNCKGNCTQKAIIKCERTFNGKEVKQIYINGFVYYRLSE